MNITIPMWSVVVVSVIVAVAITVAVSVAYWWGKINQLLDEIDRLQGDREQLMAESCNRKCAKRRPRDEDCKNQLMTIGLDAFKDALGESKPDETKDNIQAVTESNIEAAALPPICVRCHKTKSGEECGDYDETLTYCGDFYPPQKEAEFETANKEAAESVKGLTADEVCNVFEINGFAEGVDLNKIPIGTPKAYNKQHAKALERCASTKKAAQKSIGMTEDEIEAVNDNID